MKIKNKSLFFLIITSFLILSGSKGYADDVNILIIDHDWIYASNLSNRIMIAANTLESETGNKAVVKRVITPDTGVIESEFDPSNPDYVEYDIVFFISLSNAPFAVITENDLTALETFYNNKQNLILDGVSWELIAPVDPFQALAEFDKDKLVRNIISELYEVGGGFWIITDNALPTGQIDPATMSPYNAFDAHADILLETLQYNEYNKNIHLVAGRVEAPLVDNDIFDGIISLAATIRYSAGEVPAGLQPNGKVLNPLLSVIAADGERIPIMSTTLGVATSFTCTTYDFEGSGLAEGAALSDQFSGITIHNTALAKEGNPNFAFNVDNESHPAGFEYPNEDDQVILTDRDNFSGDFVKVSVTGRKRLITLDQTTNLPVSLYAADVDHGEILTFYAVDTNDQDIVETVISSGGDARAVEVVLDPQGQNIKYIDVHSNKSPGFAAIDNLTICTSSSVQPTCDNSLTVVPSATTYTPANGNTLTVDLVVDARDDIYGMQADLTVNLPGATITNSSFGSYFDPTDRLTIDPVTGTDTWSGAISQRNPATAITGPSNGTVASFTVTLPTDVTTLPDSFTIDGTVLFSGSNGLCVNNSCVISAEVTIDKAAITGLLEKEFYPCEIGDPVPTFDLSNAVVSLTPVGGGTTYTTTADAAGVFDISGVPSGDYTLTAQDDFYLLGSTNVTLSNGSVLDAGTLTMVAGDVDLDGDIDLDDHTALAALFNQIFDNNPAVATADFNDDDTVNIRDLSILGGNIQ